MSFRILWALPLLALLASCGGGGGSTAAAPTAATASKLHYVNPIGAPGHFLLVVEPATNDTSHLLLDLIGPTGTLVKGVAFFVTVGAGATWGNPGGPDPHAKAGTELRLGTPALFKSKLNAGDLQVGLFQTGAPPASLGPASIVTLALDLGASIQPGPLGLVATTGKAAVYVDGSGTEQPLILDLGTLAAQ